MDEGQKVLILPGQSGGKGVDFVTTLFVDGSLSKFAEHWIIREG